MLQCTVDLLFVYSCKHKGLSGIKLGEGAHISDIQCLSSGSILLLVLYNKRLLIAVTGIHLGSQQ